jgi:hypothetical protein
MPIYSVKVRGDDTKRVVRASSAAKARDHLVEASAMNAEELADAIASGAAIETATEAEPEIPPATDAKPAKPGKPGDDLETK